VQSGSRACSPCLYSNGIISCVALRFKSREEETRSAAVPPFVCPDASIRPDQAQTPAWTVPAHAPSECLLRRASQEPPPCPIRSLARVRVPGKPARHFLVALNQEGASL